MPLDVVIEFKRDVYQLALTELSRFLPETNYHNRYLRGGPRGPPRAFRTTTTRRATCRPAIWRRSDADSRAGQSPPDRLGAPFMAFCTL